MPFFPASLKTRCTTLVPTPSFRPILSIPSPLARNSNIRASIDGLTRRRPSFVLLGTIAEKGAGFKSLRDAWADTTTAHGRLMLTVLGGLAEFERELIRTRTGEGRERARGYSRSQAQADRTSAARGNRSSGSGRGANGDRAVLQCQPQYD